MYEHLNTPIPTPVDSILNRIMKNGGQAYIVGGAIRDILLGRPIKDWDIGTNLVPEQVENLFADAVIISTGKKFGTITVLIDNLPVEITTFRGEQNYTDLRHPDRVIFLSDIYEDLLRRDFTINAIAFNPYLSEPLVDPLNGMNDLAERIIKTVGKAEERFSEDPLRMMRCIRFFSELGFSIEQQTMNAVYNLHPLLAEIATERIRDELNKILLSPYASDGLTLLNQTGIFNVILPEQAQCFYNNSNHIFNTVGLCNPDLITRIAALFHHAYLPEDSLIHGIPKHHHYHNYAKPATQIARCSMRILKYNAFSTDMVTKIIQNIDVLWSSSEQRLEYTLRKLIGEMGVEDVFRLLDLLRADLASQFLIFPDNYTAEEEPKIATRLYQAGVCIDNILARHDPVVLSDLAINGTDLIDIGIGIKDKCEIGKALKQAYEWVLNEPEWNIKELLLSKLKSIHKQQ